MNKKLCIKLPRDADLATLALFHTQDLLQQVPTCHFFLM